MKKKQSRDFSPEELVGSRTRGSSTTEVTPGIHRRVVNSHFVMQVRPCRTPALAFQSNNISALHMRAHMRAERRKMPVPGGNPKSVVNHHQLAVSRALIHHRDNPIRRRVYRIAVMRSDVHPRMERALATERVQPLSKMPGNLAHHRPKRRHNPQAAQLR